MVILSQAGACPSAIGHWCEKKAYARQIIGLPEVKRSRMAPITRKHPGPEKSASVGIDTYSVEPGSAEVGAEVRDLVKT